MRVFVEFDNRRVYWQVDVRHEWSLLQNLAHWFGPAEEESLAPSEMIPIREALAEIREILDRDDFGDSWEHDDWVFRDAAEKKLSEIEDALDGAPEPEERL